MVFQDSCSYYHSSSYSQWCSFSSMTLVSLQVLPCVRAPERPLSPIYRSVLAAGSPQDFPAGRKTSPWEGPPPGCARCWQAGCPGRALLGYSSLRPRPLGAPPRLDEWRTRPPGLPLKCHTGRCPVLPGHECDGGRSRGGPVLLQYVCQQAPGSGAFPRTWQVLTSECELLSREPKP